MTGNKSLVRNTGVFCIPAQFGGISRPLNHQVFGTPLIPLAGENQAVLSSPN